MLDVAGDGEADAAAHGHDRDQDRPVLQVRHAQLAGAGPDRGADRPARGRAGADRGLGQPGDGRVGEDVRAEDSVDVGGGKERREEGAAERGFALFDKKGTGAVPREVLGDLLRALGQNPTQAEVADIIAGAPKDGTCDHPAMPQPLWRRV